MTQAHRIIARFGGHTQTAIAIGYSRQAIHAWTSAREKGGSEGYIPARAIPLLKKAALRLGINLTAEDWAV